MDIESVTHQGLVRSNNEDRLLIKPFENSSTLLAIADGMGGHAAGEIAAELALQAISGLDPHTDDSINALLGSVKEAQKVVLSASSQDEDLKGMGTTLTVTLILQPLAYWAHVGDTRLYHFSQGILKQISDDHTIPGNLFRKGKISKEEARLHPYGNVLLKCVGCDRFEPDAGRFGVTTGDLVMLSSDGLHDLMSDEKISAILAADTSLTEKADQLLKSCLDSGGKDNISVIIARI
jgi:PPM family protein phosphatase